MNRILIVCLLAMAGLLVGGFLGYQQYYGESKISSKALLLELELPDVDRNLRNGSEWLGKLVIVNHWATWCSPCREEIPMLIEYQRQMSDQSVQIVGVAHDLLDATRIFGDEIGIDYPSLVAIVNGSELLRTHGNENAGALPFTAIFDRSGNLARTKLGLLSAQELDSIIQPLL